MRRTVAAVLVIGGLIAVLASFYQDAVVAMLMLAGVPTLIYGLAGYDIDAAAPDDRSGW